MDETDTICVEHIESLTGTSSSVVNNAVQTSPLVVRSVEVQAVMTKRERMVCASIRNPFTAGTGEHRGHRKCNGRG